MTQIAGEHYEHIAQESDVQLPDILQGESITLVAQIEDPQVPVHMLEAKSVQERLMPIVRGLRHHLGVASRFIEATTFERHPDMPQIWMRRNYEKVTASRMIQQLRPTKLKTGHLSNFRVEALAPQEIAGTTSKFANGLGVDVDPVVSTAYILLSGDLYSGRSLGRVGSLAKIAMAGFIDEDGRIDRLVSPARLQSKGIKINELLGISGVWESTAVARVVEGDSLSRQIAAGLPSMGARGGGTNSVGRS